MRSAALIAVFVVAAAVDARAQVSVGVAAGGSRQEAGASDLPYLGPAYGGTAVALVGMVDFALSRWTSAGGEGSVAGTISGDQSQRTSSTTNAFTSRHRDSVFSGVFKIGTPADNRVHVAAAVGGGFAARRTAREGTSAPLFPPSARSPFTDIVSNVVFAYSLGGDVDVRATNRLRVIAVARWHRLRDDDKTDQGVTKRGVSSTIFRAGVGAAWRF